MVGALGLFRRVFDGADTMRHDPDVNLVANRGRYTTNYVKGAVQSDEAPSRCHYRSVEAHGPV
jgi:hypothetical protein